MLTEHQLVDLAPTGRTDSAQEPPSWLLLQLPAELVERITGHLHANDVPCNLRLVNKAAAAHFGEHKTIRISSPVPHDAFRRQWSEPGALAGLTLARRRQLLCLTAASGVVSNLEFLLLCIGIPLTDDAFAAAAASGQLSSCRWLRAHNCPVTEKVLRAAAAGGHLCILQWLWGPHAALSKAVLHDAAAGGHAAVCEWLLSCDCPWSEEAPAAAARGGHVGLMYDLLDEQLYEHPSDVDYGGLLVGAARGCSYGTLQDVLALVVQHRPEWEPRPPAATRQQMLAAAAASTTPDWRRKAEWMLERGYVADTPGRSCALDWHAVAAALDPVGRLAWLSSHGWLEADSRSAVAAAAAAFAAAGNVAALRFLLDLIKSKAIAQSAVGGLLGCRGGRPFLHDAAVASAKAGHLATLQLLQAWSVDNAGVSHLETGANTCASQRGNVLMGMVAGASVSGGSGGGADFAATILAHDMSRLYAEIASAAAGSGSLELLDWMQELGCTWVCSTFAAAAGAGWTAGLEWLAQRHCPMGAGEPYIRAALNRDTATLACLRRLGCPWGRPDHHGVAARLVLESRPGVDVLPLLRWLVAEGCPTDWEAVQGEMPEYVMPALSAWLRCQIKKQRRCKRGGCV
ncbi:hypothetical protein GPECTOR_1g267 [Gonium pectorale]|uniref:Uncharacterized protein n=1 Tax=Gonium pectorale TaxID=33097 RepID=A0A150H2S7_GONPE|nr:hypothetical protein GPECTOR_1g267 [Gonium pectorale]|eukprot:KXZ56303.1 hypothetical protein GPECTOR_1g267 [Gonium pectorale]